MTRFTGLAELAEGDFKLEDNGIEDVRARCCCCTGGGGEGVGVGGVWERVRLAAASGEAPW
jgi:hypothetical protein